MSQVLTRPEKDSLDEELFRYNSIAKETAKRKIELDSQKGYDSNIGGGHANRISRFVENQDINCSGDNNALGLIHINHLNRYYAKT